MPRHPKHKLELKFVSGNGSKTAISCMCGAKCGTVTTGTRPPEILRLYREHIEKET